MLENFDTGYVQMMLEVDSDHFGTFSTEDYIANFVNIVLNS